MIARIEGKLYDTKMSEEVATYDPEPSDGSLYGKETLYRTREGNWFLHMAAGDKDEQLEPMAKDQVIEWLDQTGLRESVEIDLI